VPAALLAALAAPACAAGRVSTTASHSPAHLDPAGREKSADPTVRGTRLAPASLDEAHAWGLEPGGGVRATVSGVRFVLSADGSLSTADDLLPAAPTFVVSVPGRMGGGFLLGVGPQLWRADSWLGRASPLFRGTAPLAEVLVGLDRAYVVLSQGTLAAFDPRNGAPQDLGALPRSPRMGRLAALDGWHAVAISDLRGAMFTTDAGVSWKPLPLPIDPADAFVSGESIIVQGVDAGQKLQFWEMSGDGQLGRIPAAPPRSAGPPLQYATTDPLLRVLGSNPLSAAIEDGFPLGDGTALVARDGVLARVRLSDGSVAESVPDAFPLRPARCHAVSLATTRDALAFGFVCGEPFGRTVVYRWDPSSTTMIELRRFTQPRQVLAFGNGAIAVHGPCAAEGHEATAAEEETYCLMRPEGTWREQTFRGADVDRARLVTLSDGRVALVRPPAEDLSTARLTITDGTAAVHVPLRFPLLGDDVSKALLHGVWLDGFEERRPGVVGGWVDAAGSVVGVEVSLEGSVRVGEYIRDAGSAVASGRWALGWTASRTAYETTDGGMTWTKGVDVPEPIAAARERVCGPVGCIAAGWLRVGWTAHRPTGSAAPAVPPLALRAGRLPPSLRLQCDRMTAETLATTLAVTRAPGGQPALVAPGTRLPPFCGKQGPDRPADTPAIVTESVEGAGWPRRAPSVATVYAWGPAAGDWDTLGRWEVRWRSPHGACFSASGPAPWPTIDAAARAFGRTSGASPGPFSLVQGDEGGHALLAARRASGVDLVILESGRSPLEVRRQTGESLPDLEGAMQVGGHWYVASSQPGAQLPATVLWRLDGGVAKEVARVARTGERSGLRLARSTAGRALGLIIEGRPSAVEAPAYWVVGVDVETGETGEPEPLAPLDFAGHNLPACSGDDAGWQFDLPYAGMVEVQGHVAGASPLQAPVVTLRVTRDHACVDRVVGFGTDEAPPPTAGDGGGGAARSTVRTIDVSILSAKARTALRCSLP
jgi:hypothetical protein